MEPRNEFQSFYLSIPATSTRNNFNPLEGNYMRFRGERGAELASFSSFLEETRSTTLAKTNAKTD